MRVGKTDAYQNLRTESRRGRDGLETKEGQTTWALRRVSAKANAFSCPCGETETHRRTRSPGGQPR